MPGRSDVLPHASPSSSTIARPSRVQPKRLRRRRAVAVARGRRRAAAGRDEERDRDLASAVHYSAASRSPSGDTAAQSQCPAAGPSFAPIGWGTFSVRQGPLASETSSRPWPSACQPAPVRSAAVGSRRGTRSGRASCVLAVQVERRSSGEVRPLLAAAGEHQHSGREPGLSLQRAQGFVQALLRRQRALEQIAVLADASSTTSIVNARGSRDPRDLLPEQRRRDRRPRPRRTK